MTLWLAVGASLISGSSGDKVGLILAIPMILALFTAIALMLVVVASVGVGLPLWWLLNRFNRESRVVYTIAGAITGTGVLLLVAYLIQGPRFPSTSLLEFIAQGALSGAVSGWTWGSNKGAMAPPAD